MSLVSACAGRLRVRVGLAVPRRVRDRRLGGAMSAPSRGRLPSVLEAERLEADGTELYRNLAAYDTFGPTSAIERV